MVLGLAYGGTGQDERSAREMTYAAAQEFLAAFESAHGSVSCTALLGYNLGDPAEAATAREAGAVPRICTGLVRSAALLVEGILARGGRTIIDPERAGTAKPAPVPYSSRTGMDEPAPSHEPVAPGALSRRSSTYDPPPMSSQSAGDVVTVSAAATRI